MSDIVVSLFRDKAVRLQSFLEKTGEHGQSVMSRSIGLAPGTLFQQYVWSRP